MVMPLRTLNTCGVMFDESNVITNFEIHLFQQLDTVQQILEPLQDGIIALTKLAAGLEGDNKAALVVGLEDIKKAEQLTRNRLYILQIWRKFDYETANTVAKKKNGEFEDPDLVKALEDRDKKEEKAKRERERARAATPYRAKRGRYEGSSPHASGTYGAYRAQMQDRGHGRSQRGGHRGGYINRDWKTDGKCYTCGQGGHQFKECPDKK